MEQKGDRFYLSAPLEKDIDLEQRLEKKLKDVNSLMFQLITLKK